MELGIIKFIRELPDQERRFYLLMRAYERDMNDIRKYDRSLKQVDNAHIKELSALYEREILQTLRSNNPNSVYEDQKVHNDKAEPSSIDYNSETNNSKLFFNKRYKQSESIQRDTGEQKSISPEEKDSPQKSEISNLSHARTKPVSSHDINNRHSQSQLASSVKKQYDQDEFAEALGEWASSFSDDEEDDSSLLDRISKLKMVENKILDREPNSSDLSSEEN
ncbi:Hypothetical protein HVR_LOCUS1199 [uncultured virus]|nr:Hypothetical protein HVR_LOCUS1199 [uncultured virus]